MFHSFNVAIPCRYWGPLYKFVRAAIHGHISDQHLPVSEISVSPQPPVGEWHIFRHISSFYLGVIVTLMAIRNINIPLLINMVMLPPKVLFWLLHM